MVQQLRKEAKEVKLIKPLAKAGPSAIAVGDDVKASPRIEISEEELRYRRETERIMKKMMALEKRNDDLLASEVAKGPGGGGSGQKRGQQGGQGKEAKGHGGSSEELLKPNLGAPVLEPPVPPGGAPPGGGGVSRVGAVDKIAKGGSILLGLSADGSPASGKRGGDGADYDQAGGSVSGSGSVGSGPDSGAKKLRTKANKEIKDQIQREKEL